MACSRKSLASGYNFLSRRFHPSFSHIVQHDRERSAASQSSEASPRLDPSSQLFNGCRYPLRDWRRFQSGLPLGIEQCSRNYSSSSGGSNEIVYMNDVADVLTETTVDSSTVAAASGVSSVPAAFPGEVAAAAADSFPPVAALQHLIDAVHSFTGLNWWVSIALTTVLIRGATTPLLINQLKASAKLNVMRPELEKLKQEIDNNMDPESLQEGQKRMKALFKKHGVTPFTPLKGALIQGPIFISFFFAISNMVEKVPSFKGGGAYWFMDLTTPDTMYIFPVLTSLTFLATVELNMQEGMEGNPMAKTMKNFSRVLALMTVPFTASFPKAIFCYWMTSNLFSLMYGFVLKRPSVKKFLDLPDVVPQPESASQPNFSFFGTSKPVLPTASSPQENGSAQVNSPGRRMSSSTVISQRIRNLEKSVKARNKTKKRSHFPSLPTQRSSNMWKDSAMATNESGMGKVLLAAAAIGLGSWFYSAIQPPVARPCGLEGGPPVTATRIQLRDGRHLAYAERGVPKKTARFKIIFCHGFSGTRLDGIGASPEIMEELGVYMVSYDRAGRGESDPNSRRSRKSEALDVEELADALELGSKFYVIGLSLGGHAVWSSIKYIPGRLAGAALLAPVINYRWPRFPKNLSQEAYKKQHIGDQWALRVSYYTPWLLHWWMKQSWLPTSTVIKGTTPLPNKLDAQIRDLGVSNGMFEKKQKLAAQQGIHESYYRDMLVMFGKWEFDPMDLPEPPFPVHLWQGDEDGLVPVTLQQYICHRLSWIKYHELPMTGHFLARVPGFGDLVLKTLLGQPST